MLTIRHLEILDVEIPFRFTFKHALAERNRGHSILVRASGDDGREGYGECVPRSYVTGETPDTVRAALRDVLGPPLVGASFASFEEVVRSLEERLVKLSREQHAAFCALELAVLDLAGRTLETSAGEAVAGPAVSDRVVYSAVVSADNPEQAVATLRMARKLGFARAKVKVGGGREQDSRLLAEAREILGEECGLRVDANCAWNAREALETLEDLARFRLEAVEQPLPAEDLDGLAWLTERSPVPVMVDESLASRADAARLVERRACHLFNIRISKCGGLINSVHLRDLAKREGIGCQLGAQVGETALLSAAGRQFAARSPGVLFCEGSYGVMLLESDIGTEDLTLGPGGSAPVLEGPGLGVEVDAGKLSGFTTGRIAVGEV